MRIPKLRTGAFFPDDLIERYCRVDRALVAAVAEMYVMGISTRKVEEVAGALGVSSMSKSQVSRLCECLDAEVGAFRRQRFDGVRFAYLWLDATYVKCRVEGRSVSQAVVTAIGLDDTGHKRFLGVDCVDTESHADWRAFLADLRARGVAAGKDGVLLASIYFSPFSPTYFYHSSQCDFADRANALSPLLASCRQPPCRRPPARCP